MSWKFEVVSLYLQAVDYDLRVAANSELYLYQMPETRPVKVVYVIAHRDFRDEEFFIPREVLETAGVSVSVASFENSPAVGLHGGITPVNLTVPEIKSGDFDAILIAGGPGIHKHFEDADLRRVVLDFYKAEKIIGAICAGPTVLARAGVLKGKNATVWKTEDDGELVRTLVNEGAFYHNEPVVTDGNIVTANAPAAAESFGKKILSFIKPGKTPAL